MIEVIAAVVVLYLLFDIRHKISTTNAPKVQRGQSIVMDTSALIDGRVVDVISGGFLVGDIIVSKLVLRELQMLADGRDSHKRARARYGLDVIESLKVLEGARVIIDDSYVDQDTETDEAVLQLAKKHGARLCTTDFNLNKVATAEGVTVINVNELAQSLRPKVLPGEQVKVKIIQKGESKGQGVGYLEDGTMAVVDNGFRMKGKTITATVDRMIQTKAGKMVFATYTVPKKSTK